MGSGGEVEQTRKKKREIVSSLISVKDNDKDKEMVIKETMLRISRRITPV